MFCVLESMTIGFPTALPQVLAMAALKVAISMFVVPEVAPGAAKPTQLVASFQLPIWRRGTSVPILAGRKASEWRQCDG